MLASVGGTARADSTWSEYGQGDSPRPLDQLTESACDIDLSLRGAIAEVAMSQRLANPGPALLAATSVLELPPGAQLVEVAAQPDRRKTERSIVVDSAITSDVVESEAVLGADPVLATALVPLAGHPRFRLIVQPIQPDHDMTITARWLVAGELRDGEIRVTLPAHPGLKCRVVVHATPGPGTKVAHVRFNGVDAGGTTYELGDQDLTIGVELAFARAQPVVWTQTESLGNGFTARAITVATPGARLVGARRALLVIDGSRSMELVGRHNVKKLVRAIAGALPKGSELEAIFYDRTAARVFPSWTQPTATALSTLDTMIDNRPAGNGSDTAAAFALAKSMIEEDGPTPLVVLISDGVLGDIAANSLSTALATQKKGVEVHALVVEPGRMRDPDTDAVRDAVVKFGGSYTVLQTETLDRELANAADWLRPAWLQLALPGRTDFPEQLAAGTGVVRVDIVRSPAAVKLSSRRTQIAARPAPSTAFAQLALGAEPEALAGGVELAMTPGGFSEVRRRHPAADAEHSLVVLASAGKVAANRRAMIAGGGPFTRMVAFGDPAFPPEVRVGTVTATGGSAIDDKTLELLFRTQLQPAAYSCYQKAISRSAALAGTVTFQLEIGRGELTRATVRGLGDTAFDACVLDAAYLVTPPLPNPDFNVDDRTVANYPITFAVRENKPFAVAGDADSASPLDISAIKGGVPRGAIKAGDTSTPLGDLRVTPNP
ncbi:MAG: VWA domain-containing protein [Kofleriaceae bacterium]|nr:VWA domain-containing protein [Kofleriaceae bacterium]